MRALLVLGGLAVLVPLTLGWTRAVAPLGRIPVPHLSATATRMTEPVVVVGAFADARHANAVMLELTGLWERNFGLMVAFRDREAHCDVPVKHTEQGVKLGTWLNNQRVAYGKRTLNAARRERLEALGVAWDVHEAHWERGVELLTAFRDREAHCNVPAKHEEMGEKLGKWLSNQRAAHGKGVLDTVRLERLEKLGVVWDPFEQQWERNFELLTAFHDREAHCDVPTKHEEKDVKLGLWLHNQRKVQGKGTLDVARRDRLEALGVRWRISRACR